MLLPTLFLLIALGVGAWLFRQGPQATVDRLSLALLPVVGVGVAGTLLHTLLAAPARSWNEARLAPVFAMQYGYQLYYGPTEGPVLNHLYGPVSALIYLPTTFTTSPTVATMVGLGLNMALFFGPAGALLLGGRRQGWPELRFRLLVWASFYFLAFVLPPLAYSGLVIHTDAPALGLSLLACLLVHRGAARPGLVPWAALLLALAVWSKQTFAPLLLALPLGVWATMSRGLAVRFGLWTVGLCGVLGLVFGLWLGFPAMTFNMLSVPTQHPWQSPDRVGLLLSQGAVLLGYCLPPLALWAAMAWYGRRGQPDGGRNPRLGLLLLVAGAALAPMALVSRVKVGGWHNNLVLTLFFVLLAAGLALVEGYGRMAARGEGRRGALMLATMGLLLLVMARPMVRLFRIESAWAALPQTSTAVAYRASQASPDELYFPWHPLSMLLASGELFHFEYGLFDREIGGAGVSDAHLRRHLPTQMRLVAFAPADAQNRTVMGYLPGWAPVEVNGALAGWTVFHRSTACAKEDMTCKR